MKDLAIGICIGLAIAYLGVYLTGFSAAITVPEKVSEILSGKAFIVWETAVTQFLGYGVVTFLALFFSIKLMKLNPWVSALAAVVVCEAALFAAYSSTYMIYVPHILVLIVCATCGALLAKRRANA
ncbi:hypothetical protein HXX02_00130 [Microbulbifer elongatus]|uniref:Uncharacterized protein n=1 Tax=Microbulbifer elongatus TaxID=86173 RepID=A0ABT1NVK9_9GAMM|nr:hypothetical protein [Microbulbifer elongatus]MCQ3827842.1 hypothetical protein [Microbulbifer elongatus]